MPENRCSRILHLRDLRVLAVLAPLLKQNSCDISHHMFVVEFLQRLAQFIRPLHVRIFPEENGCPGLLILGPRRGRFEQEVATACEELSRRVTIVVGNFLECLSCLFLLSSLRENLLPLRDPESLHAFHDELLDVKSIDDELRIWEALARHPVEAIVHVERHFFHLHPFLHRQMLHEFFCNVCGFRALHQCNEFPFLLVCHDRVELAVNEAGFVDGQFLSEILREEEFFRSGGCIVAGKIIAVVFTEPLHPVEPPDTFHLHRFQFDLLLLKNLRRWW